MWNCRNLCKCSKSYCSDRIQRVQIDNVWLDSSNSRCGVPQGSVLGPFFCIDCL